MSVLLDLLKANGATDADIEAMKPLLDNKKFADKIEAELSAKKDFETKYTEVSGKVNEFESQRNVFEAQAKEATDKVTKYDEWYANQVTPALSKVQQQAIKDSERAAAAEARLAKAKEMFGFELPEDTPTVYTTTSPVVTATTATATTRTDLPDLSKYVTSDTLHQQADMVGVAIADTQNLAFEHTSLFGYEKPIDFIALRQKAVAEKRPVREIWERDFNVAGRKSEIAAERQAKVDAQRAAEIKAAEQAGFERGMSQSVNPMTREPMPSRFGVAFTKRDQEAGKPWDVVSSRSQERLNKVVSNLAKQGAA